MIPGVVASQLIGQGSGLPERIALADFVNGIYRYDGVTLTAADVIDRTDLIGGSGLEIPTLTADAPFLLNDFATRILTLDWTVVIEAEILSIASVTILLTTNTDDDGTGSYFTEIDYYSGGSEAHDQSNNAPGSVARDILDPTDIPAIPGIARIAVTRRTANLSLSLNGMPVGFATDTTPCQFGVNDANISEDDTQLFANLGGFGEHTGRGVNIRSLEIYDSQSDSVLPTLSEL